MLASLNVTSITAISFECGGCSASVTIPIDSDVLPSRCKCGKHIPVGPLQRAMVGVLSLSQCALECDGDNQFHVVIED